MLNVPGMNDVKAAVTMDDGFPLRAGGGANGQERLKRTGLASLRHRVSLSWTTSANCCHSSESGPPSRELSDIRSCVRSAPRTGTEIGPQCGPYRRALYSQAMPATFDDDEELDEGEYPEDDEADWN